MSQPTIYQQGGRDKVTDARQVITLYIMTIVK